MSGPNGARAGLAAWHAYMAGGGDPQALRDLLAEDAVFHSPVVHTPQAGRDTVFAYLHAASHVLGGENFRYLREIVDGDQAMLEFQSELEAKGYQVPIVFMTAHGDVATSVHAMKAGAIDFLQKPLRTGELLEAIQSAFAIDAGRQQARLKRQTVRDRASSLTPRETQVMGLVTSGLMNKQIAFELGISEIMVKLHRGSMMRKMKAGSLAELVRQFELLH